MARDGHVSLWHPWQDKPIYKDSSLAEKRHNLRLWSDFDFMSPDDAIMSIAQGQYYALCNDILSEREVCPDILRDKRTTAYLSRTGGCVALRIKSKKKSGFLIPARQWGGKFPTSDLPLRMQHVFQKYGYEAITPSSLSEKILRSTLKEKLFISRPSVMLRRTFIEHGKGGRIDIFPDGQYETVYENDINKAYLSFSRFVPSPYLAPTHYCGSENWQDQKVAWVQARMTCHTKGGIQPVQIKDRLTGDMRYPVDGESFESWLWSGEIEDCLAEGYTYEGSEHAYGWYEMSNFMERWSDILWEGYQREDDPYVRDIEKSMMVGLLGRFIRRPEKYSLIHKSERQEGDTALLRSWMDGGSPLSEWYMRTEEDQEIAQLTPIGSYIICECRRKIYHDAKVSERRGDKVVRIYIDSFSISGNRYADEGCNDKGTQRGQYKVKVYKRVKIVRGQFAGYDETGTFVLKATGVEKDTDERRDLISRMESMICGP